MAITDFKILAGITAMIVGGMWSYYIFIAERTHSPKMDMNFEIDCNQFDDKYYLISTKLKIKNTSKVLLEPTSAQIKLQKILPDTKDYKELSFDEFNMLKEGDINLYWPMLGQRDWLKDKAPVKLEPGETDELAADFFLLETAELIRLYGSVQNPVTGLSWVKTETIRIIDICKKNEINIKRPSTMTDENTSKSSEAKIEVKQQKPQESQQQTQQNKSKQGNSSSNNKSE